MTGRKVWRWHDPAPRGALPWLCARLEHQREEAERIVAHRLERAAEGTLTWQQLVKLEVNGGAAERARWLLDEVVSALPEEQRRELRRWLEEGGAGVAELTKQARERAAAGGREEAWELAQLLCSTGRYEEGRAMMTELSEQSRRDYEAAMSKVREPLP